MRSVGGEEKLASVATLGDMVRYADGDHTRETGHGIRLSNGRLGCRYHEDCIRRCSA